MSKKKKIPMADLSVQYGYLKKDIFKKWKKLCSSSSFILGDEVRKFEEEFAAFCGRKYAVGLSSGTSALHVALEVLGARGHTVITTPFTFIATCEAIIHAGGKFVFADIDPDDYTISPEKIRETSPTESDILLPVHLYGHPADMDEIMDIAHEYNMRVVEDCAQAHGAVYGDKKVGSFGKVGCFSFYPGKNLGAYGDAGCIVCDDRELADLARRLRTHGSTDKYFHTEVGYNYRLDALQAAVLRVKLRYLNEWNQQRREKAALYNELLKDSSVRIPPVSDSVKHVYHQYSILAPERDSLRNYLEENRISTAVHYPIPLHLQPSFSFAGYEKGDFPVAERVSSECLSLPMYPELKKSDIEYIAEKIRAFYAAAD